MTTGGRRATLLMRGREAPVGDITIRNIDDSLMQALEERASAAGRSLEEEARQILRQAAKPDGADVWERMRKFRSSLGNRSFPDSGEALREIRDERAARLGEP